MKEVREMEARMREEAVRQEILDKQEIIERLEWENQAGETARIEMEEEARKREKQRRLSQKNRKKEADKKIQQARRLLSEKEKEATGLMSAIEEVEGQMQAEQQAFQSAESRLKHELARAQQDARKNQTEARRVADAGKRKAADLHKQLQEAKQELARQKAAAEAEGQKNANMMKKMRDEAKAMKAKLQEVAKRKQAEEKAAADKAAAEAKAAHDANWKRGDFDFSLRLRQLGIAATSPDVTVESKKISGFLMKLGGSLRPKWSKKYFVLDLRWDGFLKYYAKATSSKEKGGWALESVTRCIAPSASSKKYAQHPDTIIIETEERSIYCRAPNELAKRHWMLAISAVGNQAKPTSPQ